MAQRLRLCPSNPGVTGSIPALGTKILGWGTKIPSAAKKKKRESRMAQRFFASDS